MLLIISCLAAAAGAAFLTWLLCRMISVRKLADARNETANLRAVTAAERSSLEETLRNNRTLQAVTEDKLAAANAHLLTAEKSITRLESENKHAAGLLAAQKEFAESMKSEMERQFRLIAGATLDENSEKISRQQGEKLQSTLQPFREQIEMFRKNMEEKFSTEIADRNTLKGELSKVFALTNSLTEQAGRLTNALTSQTKQQGNFGEDILETILTNAGMQNGVHYEKQFSTINEDGRRIIPDIIIHCPGGYSLVIDSKVSLTHYMRYCNDVLTPEEEKNLRKEIWLSFKNHIDGLSGKKYEQIADCADFVLMFTPVESAFAVAARYESDIRAYAFSRKVFLVTPSNLLLVVRMISDLWQKDRVNKDAAQMAERARLLYEKACGFLDSFAAVGASLDKARGEWMTASGRLQGTGGLYSQGKMLQELIGSKSKKILPPMIAGPGNDPE